MKSVQQADRTVKNPLNQSTSKMQYSFNRDIRFKIHRHRTQSTLQVCSNNSTLSKRFTTFGFGNRYISRAPLNPSPTHYKVQQPVFYSNGIRFGRSIRNSKFVSKSPGPAKYSPKKSKKSISFSFRSKLHNNSINDSPGYVYNINSSMLDKNKVLSIYAKKTSVKFVNPKANYNRKNIEEQKILNQGNKNLSLNPTITRKGDKYLSELGGYMVQGRRFLKQSNNNNPGPGQYNKFSQFIKSQELL